MLKNTFYKNFYQSICCFASILFIDLVFLIAYIDTLKYGRDIGWFCLICSMGLIASFFIFGFYFIFQKVIINEDGIKIVLIHKLMREHKWEEIETIEKANFMKNPALIIKLVNGSEIHLDNRKIIVNAIEKYSNKKIVK